MDRLTTIVERARGGRIPFLVGITGSVASGKTAIATALAAALGPRATVVTTDSFLYPNAVLDRMGLLMRKGFPESFDFDALHGFLADARAGRPVRVPVYSHLRYDVLPGEVVEVDAAGVVIVEGVAVSQIIERLDLTVYVDAAEDDLERWYVERFLRLCTEGRGNPGSFFALFADLDTAQAAEVGRAVWRTVNLVNLREHLAPTRERADVVVVKGPDHAIVDIRASLAPRRSNDPL